MKRLVSLILILGGAIAQAQTCNNTCDTILPSSAVNTGVLDAKDCGVIADGIAADAPCMQKAVNTAIANGFELRLPAGTINLSTTSLLLNNLGVAPAPSTGVTMRGAYGRDGALGNSTFLYTGTGSALRMISATTCTSPSSCTPQPCNDTTGGFIFVFTLGNFTIQQGTTNNMQSALEIRCGSEFYVHDVAIFTDATGQHNMQNGILCDACNTSVTFERIAMQTQNPTSGPFQYALTLINGFNFVNTAGAAFASSGILVHDSLGGASNVFRLEGIANFTVRNFWQEASDVSFFVDDSSIGGFILSDTIIEQYHGLFNANQPNQAAMRIMNINSRTFDALLNVNIRNSDWTMAGGAGTPVRHVVPAAQCSRNGLSIVTCTCSSGSQCPSSIPISGGGPGGNLDCRINNCFSDSSKSFGGGGVYVYKVSATEDTVCPNGLKKISGSTATTFSYAESGSAAPCGGTTLTFIESPYAIQYITNNLSKNNQSNVDLTIDKSHFDTYFGGVFGAYSLDTQTVSSSNWVNVHIIESYGQVYGSGAQYTRNLYPFGHGTDVNRETALPGEVHWSNSPANLTNVVVSTEHRKGCYRLTLSGATMSTPATAVFSTFDSQNICTCSNNTSIARPCIATVAAGSGTGYRGWVTGTVTASAVTSNVGNGDVVDVCCY